MAPSPDLLTEKLYSFALASEYIESYCHFCFTTDHLRKCMTCKMYYYCGSECQKADWPEHRQECAAIKKHDGIADEGIRLVMRLAVKWAKGENAVDAETHRSLVNLEDHYDHLSSRATKWLADYKTFVTKPIVDDDAVKRLYCKSTVNSFGVTNEFGKTIGIGLCLKLSGINHSCKPKTRISYRGRLCTMTSVTSHTPALLQTAQHSYIDELLPREERRKLLKADYNFDCQCAGCTDETRFRRMEGFECLLCKDYVGINIGDKCANASCSYKLREDHEGVCRLALETAKGGNSSLKRTDLSADVKKTLAEKLLSVFDGSLYKLNILRLPALRALYEEAIKEKDMEAAEKYGMLILEIQSAFQGEQDLALCHFKYGLAQVLYSANRHAACKALLAPVREVYGRTFGSNSKIYYQVEIMMK